ncbi:MAG: protein kinase [Phycisphaerae bacterium]
MSAPARRTADEVFFDALERHGAEREAFVARACAADEALRADVESLLRAHERAGAFMAAPSEALPAAAAHADALDAERWVGQRIGSYLVRDVLGAGGMGVVLLAERADEQFEQRVAIKVIRAGMATNDVLRRFRHERHVLAQLDHPNIARLIDGGATEDGTPYLVMECVRGEPIDRYCEERGLSVSERLRLFLRVCAPVQHAHQHLVVHRDLKPGNILITPDGEPRLLDFGIAKVLDPSATVGAATTAPAQRLLTPRYASPEQLRGEAVTTASDIYSLGVILYELLAGVPPFVSPTDSARELEQLVTTQEPVRPSAAVRRVTQRRAGPGERDSAGATWGRGRAGATPGRAGSVGRGDAATRRLSRQLAGDLDNVVLMALRREPRRRYASVGELTEDLRRHLDGLPVAARPSTLRYRAGKFARRHAVGLAAAGVLVLGLSIATLLSTIWYLRADDARRTAESAQGAAERAQKAAEDARRVAQAERDRANRDLMKQFAVRAFLTQLLGDLRGADGGAATTSPTVVEAVDARVGGLCDGTMRLDADIEAAVRAAAGELYRWLNEPAHAIAQFEAAAELLARDGEATRDLGDLLGMLGRARLAQDDATGGIRDLRRAIATHERADTPASALAVVRVWLAEALVATGELDAAVAQLAQTDELTSSHFRERIAEARAEIDRRREAPGP